jgi:hypothetical protein
MRHRRRHLDSTGVSSSTWISNEVSITNVSNLSQLDNQVIDGVEYLVYSFNTQLGKDAIISSTVEVNNVIITSINGGSVTFGNALIYDSVSYPMLAGDSKVCRDDATSFDLVKITDSAKYSTMTLYIPAAAIRYIRLEITVPESLEYTDTIISGTYKAYYTYNTSRDVYTKEGFIVENFPATGDGSTEITEVFTFTKYGLTATAEVVRKEGVQLVTEFCPPNHRRGVTFSSPVLVELISNVPGKYFSIRVTKELDVVTGNFPKLYISYYLATDDMSNGLGWNVAAVPSADKSSFSCAASPASPEVLFYETINDGVNTYDVAIAAYSDGLYDSMQLCTFDILFACA